MITITIKTENDAFQGGRHHAEVARILREIAGMAEKGILLRIRLFDLNGNICGKVVLTGEDRPSAHVR